MAEILRMPKLGFDMAEGTLVRWVKTEGEAVTKGVVLAEIETDWLEKLDPDDFKYKM